MKTKAHAAVEDSQITTFDDVFDAIYDQDPGKAATMKLRSDMLMRLRSTVATWHGTQQEKARRLHITQPRLSLLMTSADFNRFRLDDLVSLTVRAGEIPRLLFDRSETVAVHFVGSTSRMEGKTAPLRALQASAKVAGQTAKAGKAARVRHAAA